MSREHDDERDDRGDLDELEPEGTFWQTYSPRFEMPISYVVSALSIALVLMMISLFMFFSGCDRGEIFKPGPKLGMTDGSDDFGEGETGGAAEIDPKKIGDSAPNREELSKVLPDLDSLPAIKDDIVNSIKLDDPNSPISLSDKKAAEYSTLEKQFRDKIIGAQKGDGTQGKKGDGNNPNGKGDGTGSDSTRARTLRWVIAFKTLGGRDYLDQLKSLGAKVIVPTADGKGAFLFRSLDGNPPQGKLMAESDWTELSGLVQFSDYTALSRQQVGEALGMSMPKGFWAFFPKELEKELARKEIGYQQRRSEDIEETRFECVNRGGKYELVVTRQTLKR